MTAPDADYVGHPGVAPFRWWCAVRGWHRWMVDIGTPLKTCRICWAEMFPIGSPGADQ